MGTNSFDAMPDTANLIAEKPPAVAMVMRVVRLPAECRRSYTAIVNVSGGNFIVVLEAGSTATAGFIG